jgi:hypothetical protein
MHAEIFKTDVINFLSVNVFEVTLADNFQYHYQYDDTDNISLNEIKRRNSKLPI